jgi:hypothetical protein
MERHLRQHPAGMAHLVEMVYKFASEDKHLLCPDGQVQMCLYSVCKYLIRFFLEIFHFFSRFYVPSLEYSFVFADPNIDFRSEVRSYPTAFLKIGISEA